ncbi:MAG: Eco57I restriction-modification methylase domain-containing protein [Anaerolineae bacterium]|nr:Eco57I restriction-modification methylase domain-containing protein [Anaerolineae bacterium]
MPVPEKILELVEHFTAKRAEYESDHYRETQARVELINPLFEELGWDVDNKNHKPPSLRDVVHEDALQLRDHRKAPDYAFRIGGVRKFFVEAKKPARSLKVDRTAAYQLRSYGWSAGLPLSILTDFAEFAVYDCRIKPSQGDDARVARLLYLTYEDYAARWDEIANLFSHDAVLNGALDRFAESDAPRSAQTVDAAFLEDLNTWRRLLAKRLWQMNNRKRNLSQADINYAVQKILDRLIFLRICEDRGIEQYGTLLALANGTHIYARLNELFKRARDRYNSGLFYFPPPERDHAEQPDSLTPELSVDDDTLKEILQELYYPRSPYVFSQIPVEILGQAYERFLGDVIRIEIKTGSPIIEIEPKPEVRKAGGVYYTPSYIVDYIVAQTLSPLLEGKTPAQAAKLRILDPACGSGSFLIGAYQFLLGWYLRAYTAESPEKHERKGTLRLVTTENGAEWRLTIKARKQILLNHLYGVDIDSRAAETTKLSLLLRALEGETDETINQQLQLWRERALPDLGNNIKCGNALIGSDFEAFAKRQGWQLSDADYARINYFDWREAFPKIFEEGGFDAVIGNPPYIRIQALQAFAPHELAYYKHAYQSAGYGNCDIYVIFVEKGLSLLKPQGALGFILPHKFFNAKYGEPLRATLAAGKHVRHVVHFGDQQVFKGATTYTCLLFLSKQPQPTFTVERVSDLSAWRAEGAAQRGMLRADSLSAKEWHLNVGAATALFERLKAMPVKLGNVAERIFQGLVTSADPVYFLDPLTLPENGYIRCKSPATGREYTLETAVVHPLCKGARDIRRYYAAPSKYVVFPYDVVASEAAGRGVLIAPEVFSEKYPNTWAYLNEVSEQLRRREKGRMDHDRWYAYVYPKNIAAFSKPKLMVPAIGKQACYTYDQEGELYFVGSGGGGGGGYGIILKKGVQLSYEYMLGLLNSQLLDALLRRISTPFQHGYYAYTRQYIENLPIRLINFADPHERAMHDQIVAAVQELLRLHRELAGAASPATQQPLQRRIAALERQVDEWVYQLYGLSAEEIRLVESEMQAKPN